MAPAPASVATGDIGEKKVEKSYLASAVDSINPWNTSRSTSRSNTPTPKEKEMPPPPPKPTPAPNPSKKADDHSINTIYGQSLRKYPSDCPPLNVMWFHAVDVPKRKPQLIKGKKEKEKEDTKPAVPKKFLAFTKNDSRSIEGVYQKLLEDVEDQRGRHTSKKRASSTSRRGRAASSEDMPNTSIDASQADQRQGIRVPVNEDFLFDVDIEMRELAPVYWLGPVYEVRRGSWFYQEGSTFRPCEENLAAQLEEGYLKVKPWTYPKSTRSRSNSGALKDVTPKASVDNLKAAAAAGSSQAESSQKLLPSQTTSHQPQTYRLFGTYMNSIVTYQDSTTAWLSSESMLSWVTSTVYQRFAGGGYMSGVKLVRGYVDTGKKDEKRPTTPTTASSTKVTEPSPQLSEKASKALKRRSAPPLARADSTADSDIGGEGETPEVESSEDHIKKQFSSYLDTADDPDKQQEKIRQRQEQEIRDDYNAQAGETQGREIEHLVLVTHGIGQLLGLRMESVNFVHDVNMLRKTLKGVYSHSADLRALNSEFGEGPGNCRVQVLPVCWRHLLDFPKRKEKKGEQDLTTAGAFEEEDEYPSLEDITVEGVAFARSLISDLALDVLLYQSAYREQIVDIVLTESNRIYKLFLERNPEFKGKVHIIGHSLGSAIMFDLLCRQKEHPKDIESLRNPLRFWPSNTDRQETPSDPKDLTFDFNVDDFYCLGSPIGLFQMLKGRTIAARQVPRSNSSETPMKSSDFMEDHFMATSPTERVSAVTGLPYSISSPKVGQLFNIFHPSDPIGYRMEPLVSPAMSALKPQALPYTKKGLSGIGVKVGQSVSGLWSSISGGIASSLLNRSLGLSNEEVANMTAHSSQQGSASTSKSNTPGAGTNITGGGVISDATAQLEKTAARKKALARQQSASSAASLGMGGDGDELMEGGGHGATLIDDELETLFARFQKKRIEEHKAAASRAEEGQALGEAWAAEEQKAQKIRREEMRVRALNRNGRVDYSIQESVLDFNPINTIASHIAYWQDEDVSHFIMSQLLSSRVKTTASKENKS
ncbi:DDHD domain-containing protein [Apiospora kogelbergensis]|uniref:DDHD domain-containing protein n=1 Tax=Apiospora kogelbergensis TaxID=1337665 RepID=UPI00312EE398